MSEFHNHECLTKVFIELLGQLKTPTQDKMSPTINQLLKREESLKGLRNDVFR